MLRKIVDFTTNQAKIVKIKERCRQETKAAQSLVNTRKPKVRMRLDDYHAYEEVRTLRMKCLTQKMNARVVMAQVEHKRANLKDIQKKTRALHLDANAAHSADDLNRMCQSVVELRNSVQHLIDDIQAVSVVDT